MLLRKKVLLILLVVITLYIGMDYGIQRVVILPSFFVLEKDEAGKDVQRCVEALRKEIQNLDTFIYDWAAWDDTYKFVEDRNRNYIQSNFTPTVFSANHFNLVYVCNLAGKVVWGRIVDPETDKPMEIRDFPKEAFPPGHPLLNHKAVDSSVGGILMTERGPLLIVSRPIVTSNDEGPIRGSIMMGRLLDRNFVAALSKQTRVALNVWPLKDEPIPPQERVFLAGSGEKNPVLIQYLNDASLRARSSFSDITGAPVLLMRVDIPRNIAMRGVAATRYATFSTLTIGLTILFIMIVLLGKIMVKPIENLTSYAISVGKDSALPDRTSISRNDEIGILTRELDNMVRRLSESGQRLQERTVELAETNEELKSDIAERKLLEQQLLKAQKMESIGTLAGGIAHDFNNLLGGILGYASLMKTKLPENHICHTYLDTIDRSANRAAELTSQLLAFARGGKYEVRPVSVNSVVEETLAIIGRTFDKSIEIETRFFSQLPSVEADAAQLGQVTMNLCVNARDAMPAGGRLIIETGVSKFDDESIMTHVDAKPGSYVTLSVTDTGIGMDKKTMQRIFEPFFTTKAEGKGTGLGLAMVYGVVKNHGGYVTVYSEPAEGATFRVYLPVNGKSEARGEHELPACDIRQNGNELILVVDDEEAMRCFAKDALESYGYRVLLAEDGIQAVETYRDHRDEIGLVVLDMVMPRLGGGGAFLELKKLNPGIRALLSTGYSENGRTRAILNTGIVGFVQKPYRVDTLLSKVRTALDLEMSA